MAGGKKAVPLPASDWELAEREYRTGHLTCSQIARMIGVDESAVRQRARRHGWSRDLTEDVRKRIRDDLARADQPKTTDDETVIALAARRGVEVIRSHYKTLSHGHALVNRLMAELEESTVHRAIIAEEIEAETAGDKAPTRRQMMQKAVALPGRAAVMRDLAGALGRIIPLERQAFNLDAPEGDGAATRRSETIEQLTARRDALAAELAALDGPEGGL